MTALLATYRVVADRATLREAPAGRQLRRLSQGETFQGRPAHQAGWVARIADDGTAVTGYVRSSACQRVELANEVGG